MGFFDGFKLAQAAATIDVGVGTAATSEGYLAQLDPTAAVAFGINPDSGRVSRELAMQVPAVRRGRALIAGTIGTLPLVAMRSSSAGGVEPVDRKLLRQLDPRTTPAWTLTWTVDDLLFLGVSWWRVLERDATGYPTAVERVHPLRVTVVPASRDQLGRVLVDGFEVADADLIRFDGPDEGVLAYGGPTIRLALALARASRRVADDDVPSGILRPTEGAPELSPGQVDDLLTAWENARQLRTTAYLNSAVDYSTVAYDAQRRQLNELAQLVSSELARLLNLPASRIGAPQGSGMTYSNTEADRRDLVDTTLAQYLAPIAQRLSMPDVTPNGTAVSFDLTAYMRGNTTELVAAGVAAIGAQIAGPEEVRTRWLGLPPRPADQQPTAPAAPAPTPSS